MSGLLIALASVAWWCLFAVHPPAAMGIWAAVVLALMVATRQDGGAA